MGLDSLEPPAQALAHVLTIEENNPCPAATKAVQQVAAPLIATAEDLADFQTDPDAFASES